MVIADEVSDANLRWANNTLTTNGVTRRNQLTVIAVIGGAVGVVSRSGVTVESLEALVRAAEHTARTAPEPRTRRPLVDSRAGRARTGTPRRPRRRSGSSSSFAPALGEAFARAAARGELLFGYAEHEMRTTYLASSAGPAGPPRPTDRARRDQRQDRATSPARPGPASPTATSATSTWSR